MQVQVVKFGSAQPLEVPEGSTVADVLSEAGIDPSSTVRFRGESVEGEQRDVIAVMEGESVVIAPSQVSHGA